MTSGDASWLSWLNLAPEESSTHSNSFDFLQDHHSNSLADFANSLTSPDNAGNSAGLTDSVLPAELALWSNINFDTGSNNFNSPTASAGHSPASLPERDLSLQSSRKGDKSMQRSSNIGEGQSPAEPSPYAKRPFGRYDHQQYHAHLEKGFNAFNSPALPVVTVEDSTKSSSSTEQTVRGLLERSSSAFFDSSLGPAAQDGSNTLFATPRQIDPTAILQQTQQSSPRKRDIPVDNSESTAHPAKRQHMSVTNGVPPLQVAPATSNSPAIFSQQSPASTTNGVNATTSSTSSNATPSSSSASPSTQPATTPRISTPAHLPHSLSLAVSKNPPVVLTKGAILAAQRDELQRIKTLNAEEEQARLAELNRIAVEDDKRRRNTAASGKLSHLPFFAL